MEVKTVAPKANRSITVDYPFPATVEEAVTQFGEQVVLSIFYDQLALKLQARVRNAMEKGLKEGTTRMSDEEIQTDVLAWKPGVAVVRSVDPVTKILAKFPNLSKDDQNSLIERLIAQMRGEEPDTGEEAGSNQGELELE